MSKRFGKNQKRKFATEVETLKKQVEHLKRDLIASERNRKSDKETIHYVAKIFGQHFAGLEPMTDIVARVPFAHRIAEIQFPEFSTYHHDVQLFVDRVLRIIELRPLEFKKTVDQLKRQVHLFLQTPSGEVAYAMSNEAWEQLRRDRRIGEHITRSMMSVINK